MGQISELASKGFRLFPLTSMSKIPLRGTNGVNDATNDLATLRNWHDSYPGCNWGVAGGIIENSPYYLIVVDVDTKGDKKGEEELQRLTDRYGQVPNTLTVRTTSGGIHFYFLTKIKRNRYRARVKGCTHIDIKSSGGYLVLWGSKTPNGAYTLESGSIDKLAFLEDWFGDETESMISGSNKSYEREGTIQRHDGRWAYMTSWAGKLRGQGLIGDDLFDALMKKRENLESGDGDRIDEFWVRSLAESYSSYPDNFPPTDQGNADRFLVAYSREVRHAHELGWFYWNSKQWARDMGEKNVIHYAGELIQIINKELLEAEDKAHVKVLNRTREMLSSYNSRKNALALAKASPTISLTPDAFDSSRFFFNLNNGVLNLETLELKSHNPDMLLTKISPINYDPESTSPMFSSFVDEITCGDKTLAKWLQVYFGYAMTADVREQLFAVFYGSGGNGKSVLVNVVSTIMGQYTLETPVESIMYKNQQQGASNDIARIKGARLVTCRESDQGQSLAESLIKSLTGGDKITARFLHKEFFEFRPVAKWILFTNHKPTIRGTDEGIWRRVKLVPFSYRVPEEKKDKLLEARLLEEASGILNWLVEGCQMWLKDGFPECPAIDNATAEYKNDEDRIGEFVRESVVIDDSLEVSASDLYKAYRSFCEEVGDRPVSSRNFPKKMEEKGYYKKRTNLGNFWQGIGLTSDAINNVCQFRA